ncbi:MAG TPA: asparagine--tRNA ligase, partial [Chitinophagaceae bacterium]|nr:asparagine--tRNA ligase [Chitinophagaceae bacterium]
MFNKRIKIKELLSQEPQGQEVIVMGWVRTFRNNQFIALNDGSTNNNLQVVVELGKFDDELLKRITTSASLKVTGIIEASLGKGQKMDLKAVTIEVLGDSDAEKYPLQPKKHSLEFLREKAHLRFRTNTFGSVFRVRHALAFAVHKFFNDKGFLYMHTPIITASDAEGAGEMFKVTTLPVDGSASRDDEGKVDFKEDFFGRATNLTVSGQLEGELGATAFGDIYTFGPTFRAENSNTARHLAEFWMIEPEMAFYDLEDNANLAEEFIQYLIKYVIDNNKEDLEFLAQRLAEEEKQLPQDKRSEMGLIEKLEFVLNNSFERLTYTEAIDILKN